MSKSYRSSSTDGEVRHIVCIRCDQETNQKVLQSVEFRWSTPDGDIDGFDNYEIVQCMGCDEISFRIGSSTSEDFDYDEIDGYTHPETVKLYPSRVMGRKLLEDEYLLPDIVRSIYKETHTALSAGLKILAGVGIRALIEAVCKVEEANGTNLEEKIDDLVVKNILTPKSAVILHETRFLGNRSAHEITAASDTELEIAFDIVENLLQHVYIIPRKAERLTARKNRNQR